MSALTILAGSGAAFAEEINVWSTTTVQVTDGQAPVVTHESRSWSIGQEIQGDVTVPGAPAQYEVQQLQAPNHDTYVQPGPQTFPYQNSPNFDFDGFFRQTFSMFGSDMTSWPQSWVWDPVFHPVVQAPQRSIYLNGLQETPPVDTKGYGIARIWFQSGELHYSIEVHELTSPITGAHFHRGPKGSNGLVMQSISFTGNHAEGVWNLSDQDARELLSGEIYINIHTQMYPDGEIRGQL